MRLNWLTKANILLKSIMGLCQNSILGFTNLQFISKLFSQAKNKPYLPWKQGGKYGFSIIIVSNYNILEGEF